MRRTRLIKLAALACLLVGMLTGQVWAQAVNSNPQTVTLSASSSETITVGPPGVGTVNFTLGGAYPALGSSPVSWTTTWNIKPGHAAVNTCIYFTNATAALTDPDSTDKIPLSYVQADPGSGFVAIPAGPNCGQANSLQVKSGASSPPNHKGAGATMSATVSLEILDVTLLDLSAGTYTGVMNIIAQAP